MPRGSIADSTFTRSEGEHILACTQMHHNMEERAPIRTRSLSYFQEHPHFADELKAGESEKPEVLAQIPGPEPRGRAEEKLKERKDPIAASYR